MNSSPRQFDNSSNASAMLKLAFWQTIASLVFGVVMYYCYGSSEAASAVYGGVTAALMNVFMATRMFTTHRLSSIRDMTAAERLARFYVSALLKVIFTLMMMSIFIVVIKVSILPFIIAYLIAAVIVNLLFLYFQAALGEQAEKGEQAENPHSATPEGGSDESSSLVVRTKEQ